MASTFRRRVIVAILAAVAASLLTACGEVKAGSTEDRGYHQELTARGFESARLVREGGYGESVAYAVTIGHCSVQLEKTLYGWTLPGQPLKDVTASDIQLAKPGGC